MIRAVAFAAHVRSGALWTGAVCFVVYAVYPRARDGTLSAAAVVDSAHRLLTVTRRTGVALPVTGAYLMWLLYRPVDPLTATPRGWVVLAILSLWGLMNGPVELGVLRMRREVDPGIGWGRYVAEGFPTDALGDGPDAATDGGSDADRVRPSAARFAAVGRPYLFACAGLAVLLLVDAALLAGGVPW